jgi:hypothetical protein
MVKLSYQACIVFPAFLILSRSLQEVRLASSDAHDSIVCTLTAVDWVLKLNPLAMSLQPNHGVVEFSIAYRSLPTI